MNMFNIIVSLESETKKTFLLRLLLWLLAATHSSCFLVSLQLNGRLWDIRLAQNVFYWGVGKMDEPNFQLLCKVLSLILAQIHFPCSCFVAFVSFAALG